MDITQHRSEMIHENVKMYDSDEKEYSSINDDRPLSVKVNMEFNKRPQNTHRT